MAITATQNLSAEMISGVRLVKITDGTDNITNVDADIEGFGTPIDITNATGISYTIANAEEENSNDTIETTEQVTLQRAQNSSAIDVVSGTKVAAGDANDTMTITTPLTHSQKQFCREAVQKGERVAAVIVEKDSSGNFIEDIILMGKLTGDFTNESGRQKTFEFTITGGEAHGIATGGEMADWNTAVNADGLARDGYDDTNDLVTLTDLSASEYAADAGVPTGKLTFIDHA